MPTVGNSPRSLPLSSTILLTILLLGVFFAAILVLATFYVCRAATFLSWRAYHVANARAARQERKKVNQAKSQKIKETEGAVQWRERRLWPRSWKMGVVIVSWKSELVRDSRAGFPNDRNLGGEDRKK